MIKGFPSGGTYKNVNPHTFPWQTVLLSPTTYSQSPEEDSTAPPLATGRAESSPSLNACVKSLCGVQPSPPFPLPQEQQVLNKGLLSLDVGRRGPVNQSHSQPKTIAAKI